MAGLDRALLVAALDRFVVAWLERAPKAELEQVLALRRRLAAGGRSPT